MGFFHTIRRGASAVTTSVASPLQPRGALGEVIAPDLGLAAPLTRAEALRNPTVRRARTMVCATIAKLPLVATDTDGPLAEQPRWIGRTDALSTPFHRMLNTADDLFFYGYSLWELTRDYDGYVIAAAHVDYDRWGVNHAGEIEVDGRAVADGSVCAFVGVDGGILADGRDAIRFARDLQLSAARSAKTPAPNLILKQTNEAPMSDEDIRGLIAAWAKARRGENQGVAYLNSAIDAIPLEGNLEQLLIEGRRDAAVDLARVCGIPAPMVDAVQAGSSLSYSNVESRLQELVTFGIEPHMNAIAARLSMDDMVPRGRSVVFETAATALPNDDGRAVQTPSAKEDI